LHPFPAGERFRPGELVRAAVVAGLKLLLDGIAADAARAAA